MIYIRFCADCCHYVDLQWVNVD